MLQSIINQELTMIKFYNGRKLVETVLTNNPSNVLNFWLTNTDVPEWTRYKIL